jgi:hypothetical protein
MPQTSLKEFFVKGVLAEKENEQPHPPSTNGATVEVAAKVAGATVLLDGGLCEYEKQREARIQVNLHRLAQLGLGAGLQPTPPNVRCRPFPPAPDYARQSLWDHLELVAPSLTPLTLQEPTQEEKARAGVQARGGRRHPSGTSLGAPSPSAGGSRGYVGRRRTPAVGGPRRT